MTFAEFVAERRAKMDTQGDLLRLIKADPDLPVITTWGELAAYIERRMGFHALQAGRVVWDDYQAKQRDLARLAKSARKA